MCKSHLLSELQIRIPCSKYRNNKLFWKTKALSLEKIQSRLKSASSTLRLLSRQFSIETLLLLLRLSSITTTPTTTYSTTNYSITNNSITTIFYLDYYYYDYLYNYLYYYIQLVLPILLPPLFFLILLWCSRIFDQCSNIGRVQKLVIVSPAACDILPFVNK